MKRPVRIIALMLTLALAAAACGSDGETTESGADTSDSTTADSSGDDAMEDDDDAMEDDDAMADDDDAMADDDDAMEDDDDAMEDDDDAMEDDDDAMADDDDAMEDDAMEDGDVALAITSINFDTSEVVVTNNGDAEVNLDGYFLCNFPDYQELSGVGAVAPGESVTISSPVGISADDGELGLYTTDSYSSPDAIAAYVEWGSAGHERSTVAVDAGIWDGNPLTVDGSTLTAG